MPIGAEIEEFYRTEYYNQQAFAAVMGFKHHYLSERDPIEVDTMVPVLTFLERFCRCGRLLDIGCGDGMFLRVARQWGWSCAGLEPSVEAARAAAGHGLDVQNGPVVEATWPESSFDAITCLQVIEHVLNPIELLACAHRWLKPDGVLLLSTPNVNSLERRLNGVNWVSFTPPGHLVYFNIGSMRRALRRTGFQPQAFVTNASIIRPPSFRRWLKRNKGRPVELKPNDLSVLPERPQRLDPLRRVYDGLLLTANELLGRLLNRQGRDLVVSARARKPSLISQL